MGQEKAMPYMLDHFKKNPFYKSLNISWKEGIPASIMQSLTDDYSIPMALFLGATPYRSGCLWPFRLWSVPFFSFGLQRS